MRGIWHYFVDLMQKMYARRGVLRWREQRDGIQSWAEFYRSVILMTGITFDFPLPFLKRVIICIKIL